MSSIPVIDYASHPAFQHINTKSDPGHGILEQFAAIDQQGADCTNAAQFERETRANWEAIFRHVDQSVEDPALGERAKMALAKAAETMAAYNRWKHKPNKSFARSNMTALTTQCLDDMHEQGAAVLQFPQEVVNQLRDLLSNEIEQTQTRHAQSPTDRCSLHMRSGSEAYKLAWRTLQETGLITAVNSYFERPVSPIYWYLAYNTGAESWYKNCYSDVGVESSNLAYSHFDHDFELAKIQIYLSDVQADNGPFAFVPGSHKWSGSRTQQFVFKEMDKSFKYPKDESLYYRPRFSMPEHRKELLQLPVPLQGSSHFGDDLVNGSELSDELYRQFHRVTSDEGNCCVFSGGDLLHYGGLVSGEDRWVLQFGLATEQPHSAGPQQKRSFLARLATKSRNLVGDGAIDGIRKFLGYGADPKQNEYTPNVKS